MTILLWAIGAIAIIWPIILMLYLDYDFIEKIKREWVLSSSYTNASSKRLREEISVLQSFIEKQDALIAALWVKSFGFTQESAYSAIPTLGKLMPKTSTCLIKYFSCERWNICRE